MARLRWEGDGVFRDAQTNVVAGPGPSRPLEHEVTEETARRFLDRHDGWVRVDDPDESDESDDSDTSDADAETEPTNAPPVDPGEFTVEELRDYLEGDGADLSDDELASLYDAEVEGQNRNGARDAIDSAADTDLGGDGGGE